MRAVQVTVKDKNPYLVRSLDGKEEETPATKVIIGNVPISFSDQEILKSVQELGCTLRSKLILERDRDEKGKLTHWLTGRRIIYVSVPRESFPSLLRWGRSGRRSTTESKRTFCVKRLLTAEIAYRKDNTRRPTVPTQCQ